MTQRIPQILAGVLLGLITVAGYVWVRGATSPEWEPADVVSPELSPYPAAEFTLTDQDGEATSLSDFRGRTVVLFFGFTHCPDVCPATLLHLGRALDEMDSATAEGIQGILVTVDPERDTPERLSEYLQAFHPSFVGLTGTPAEIGEVVHAYGIFAQRVERPLPAGEHTHEHPSGPEAEDLPDVVPTGEAGGYMVEHTARTFVIDGDGRVVHTFAPFTSMEEMGTELARIASGS